MSIAIPGAGRITPTQHEKNEWSHMAQDAYAKDLNDIGHKFSMAATLCKGEDCSLAWFDALQAEYRAWLIEGFKPADLDSDDAACGCGTGRHHVGCIFGKS